MYLKINKSGKMSDINVLNSLHQAQPLMAFCQHLHNEAIQLEHDGPRNHHGGLYGYLDNAQTKTNTGHKLFQTEGLHHEVILEQAHTKRLPLEDETRAQT